MKKEYNQDELRNKAIKYRGGLSHLIKHLDENGIPYTFGPSGETAIAYIPTAYKNIRIYDRKSTITVRVEVNKYENPLVRNYIKIGGYIHSIRNTTTGAGSNFEFYIDEEYFDKLVQYIKSLI